MRYEMLKIIMESRIKLHLKHVIGRHSNALFSIFRISNATYLVSFEDVITMEQTKSVFCILSELILEYLHNYNVSNTILTFAYGMVNIMTEISK